MRPQGSGPEQAGATAGGDRLLAMPRDSFSPDAIPVFDRAPSVILVVGNVEFFVEEKAALVAEKLAADGAEVLRFEEDAPAKRSRTRC